MDNILNDKISLLVTPPAVRQNAASDPTAT
jgi:hypothetical protein